MSKSPSPKLGARTHLPRLDGELVVKLAPFEETFRSEYVRLGIVFGITIHTPQVDEHRAALWDGVGDTFMLVDIVLGRGVRSSCVVWVIKGDRSAVSREIRRDMRRTAENSNRAPAKNL